MVLVIVIDSSTNATARPKVDRAGPVCGVAIAWWIALGFTYLFNSDRLVRILMFA